MSSITLPSFNDFLHVDDALVAAAPEEEVFIAQCLYEGAVYQYIDLAEEFQLLGILHEVFEEIARKAPDALAALLPDGARQLGKALCLKHRVAAREGDVGEGVAHDFLHQLVGRGHRAVADVPRLRIMAARTMVGASRTINGCAEARTATIVSCTMLNIANHLLHFFPSDMGYSVVELGQLAAVPAVCSTYQITGDALQLVDVVAAALRTNLEVGVSILVATVETAVAVVVY